MKDFGLLVVMLFFSFVAFASDCVGPIESSLNLILMLGTALVPGAGWLLSLAKAKRAVKTADQLIQVIHKSKTPNQEYQIAAANAGLAHGAQRLAQLLKEGK